jgi:hypothetical protein
MIELKFANLNILLKIDYYDVTIIEKFNILLKSNYYHVTMLR